MAKKIRNRMKEAINDNMLGVLIENFKAIDRQRITLQFKSDIYEYEKNVYYQNFILLDTHDLSKMFRFISDAEVLDYGYVLSEDEWLLTENNSAVMKVELNKVKPYECEIEFKFIIRGEPKDISILADQFDLKIDLLVTGVLHGNKPFWQESLYNMYHLYQIGNYTGAFMNTFIAFEGYLRSIIQDYDTKIAPLYEKLLEKHFTKELRDYRDLRNDLMHGNENNSWIDKDDIINLLSYFLEAYFEIKTKQSAKVQ